MQVDQKPTDWGGQKKMSELICVHVLKISLAASVGVRRIRLIMITQWKTDTSNSSAQKILDQICAEECSSQVWSLRAGPF